MFVLEHNIADGCEREDGRTELLFIVVSYVRRTLKECHAVKIRVIMT